MKIILLKNMENLGKEGDLAEVKDGYGRNYLIPKKIALPVTPGNLKKVDQLKAERAKKEKKKEESLANLSNKIEGLSLTITTEAKDDDTLYGNIGQAQILKLLKEKEEIELPKDKISLENPIDKLGAYKVPVEISKDLKPVLRLWVVRK
ncbi:MAG: 50S ribosomal protein L9 [Candidatus Omnitrophica bacterium]|nr:50S ribosomal protein L9 [Candidatus Omnitrophota bacterium]MCF7893167.1 50S ribosomal protein L9 [Candidatus Omnitrophota bacterium]